MIARVHHLRQSIYPVKMSLVIHDDPEAAHRHVFPGEKCNLKGYGAVMIPDGPRFFVFLKPNANPSVVAHEAFHMTVDVMEWCGFTVTKNHEPAAYLCGWIVQRIHAELARAKS